MSKETERILEDPGYYNHLARLLETGETLTARVNLVGSETIVELNITVGKYRALRFASILGLSNVVSFEFIAIKKHYMQLII